MAGSYSHATTENGLLRTPESMSIATETPGDAYETIEEMYGMIWFLAAGDSSRVEQARNSYQRGLAMSPGVEEPGEEEG